MKHILRRCHPRGHVRVRIPVALCVVLASALTGTDVARAGTLLGGYRTPGCDNAPMWHIGYRLYWTDDQGRTTSPAALNAIYAHTEAFTQAVGLASGCAVGVQVDLYDEGPTPWMASDDRSAYPPDTDAFARDGQFDAVFARYPETGAESYAGVATSTNTWKRAKFPAPAYANGVVDPSLFNEAETSTLWHEWLHLVVHFYDHPRQGWPTGDVHGACAHGYVPDPSDSNCMEVSQYFSDMMTGRVSENGAPKGLLPSEWTFFGTPTDPRHQQPWLELRMSASGGGAGWTEGLPKVILTYTDRRTGRRTYRKDVTRGVRTLLPAMRPGPYRVCLTAPASRRYVEGRVCRRYTVKRKSSQARAWR